MRIGIGGTGLIGRRRADHTRFGEEAGQRFEGSGLIILEQHHARAFTS
jgi:hypothetical protein